MLYNTYQPSRCFRQSVSESDLAFWPFSACTGWLKFLLTLQIQNVDVCSLAPWTILDPVSPFTIFLCLGSNGKIIYAAVPHQKAQNDEEISKSNMEPPCKPARRGSGSQTGTNWKQHLEFQYPDQLYVIDLEKEVRNSIPWSICLYIYTACLFDQAREGRAWSIKITWSWITPSFPWR